MELRGRVIEATVLSAKDNNRLVAVQYMARIMILSIFSRKTIKVKWNEQKA